MAISGKLGGGGDGDMGGFDCNGEHGSIAKMTTAVMVMVTVMVIVTGMDYQ